MLAMLFNIRCACQVAFRSIGRRDEVAAKNYELPADAANGLAVVLAKVGDGFEVRSQSPGRPHQLEVALGLTLKAAAGLNPIQVAVDINLQQDRWVVGRTMRCSRINTFKPKCTEVVHR